jgi:hypothetical protein
VIDGSARPAARSGRFGAQSTIMQADVVPEIPTRRVENDDSPR